MMSAVWLALVESAIALGCDTQREVVERTGMPKSTVLKAVQQLEKDGRLIRCGKRKSGRWNYEVLWDVAGYEGE